MKPPLQIDCAAGDGALGCRRAGAREGQAGCRTACPFTDPDAERLTIAHVDCDAFFAAIEKRDNPALRDQPVIVGGGRRGVVATACYVARRFGVRSAMPMFKALAACPHAVVIRPDLGKYKAASSALRAKLDALTPVVEMRSIDEAVLDLSGLERVHRMTPLRALIRLQAQVKAELGFTISIGLGPNRLLAKLASELDKPAGLACLGAATAPARLAGRPIGALPGIGPVAAARAMDAGFATLGDLFAADPRRLLVVFGERGPRLADLLRGAPAGLPPSSEPRKSISAEMTFAEDLSGLDALAPPLWRLSEKVSSRAKALGLAGDVVTLKLKSAAFQVVTRRRTLRDPTQLADVIYRTAHDLLAGAAPRGPQRLIGVGLSGLEPAGGDALDWLDPAANRRAAAERAMDRAKAKFGEGAVILGRSLTRPRT